MMTAAIQIPASPKACRKLPLASRASGLAGAWIASGFRGGPLIAPGSVLAMPFTVHDYDYLEPDSMVESLDLAEEIGYKFLAVLPGLPNVYEPGAGLCGGVTPRILFHKSPYKDEVDEILALIAKLDRSQIDDLIDRMPDSVVDPICEMCDLSEEEFDEHLATTNHPSIFVQDANALVANSSDSNSDEIPW